MRIVLRIMTCLLIVSFFSLHSMKNQEEFLEFGLELGEVRYDREIYKISSEEDKKFFADYWSSPDEMVKTLMQVLLGFHEQNKPKEKGKKNKVLPYSYMLRGMEYCSGGAHDWVEAIELKNNPGFVYDFFKLAKIFIKEYYRPSKIQFFKLMGGKRFRTVGGGDRIKSFSKSCIIPTAVRYRLGSEEEKIVDQFNSSVAEYKTLTSFFIEEKKLFMKSRYPTMWIIPALYYALLFPAGLR